MYLYCIIGRINRVGGDKSDLIGEIFRSDSHKLFTNYEIKLSIYYLHYQQVTNPKSFKEKNEIYKYTV